MMIGFGTIHQNILDKKPGWFYLAVDKEISDYYNSFMQRSWLLPRNGPHITFIAGEHEPRIVNRKEVEQYMNAPITFLYDPIIHTDNRSFWIDIECHALEDIRFNLGLPPRKFNYHLTLGNYK